MDLAIESGVNILAFAAPTLETRSMLTGAPSIPAQPCGACATPPPPSL